MTEILELNDNGLYCPDGDFYVDPWRPVARAVITHAHSDHARQGSRAYLASREGEAVLRRRLGEDARIEILEWGERTVLDGVRVSLHPAGHILGSAQVRIESRGRVAVVSGDYKIDPDPTCSPFEPLPCHLFITESTFGLPVFRWPAEADVLAQIRAWWTANREAGRASLMLAYSLGKAQRVLAGLADADGPIYTHGAIEGMNALYREAGRPLAETRYVGDAAVSTDYSGALILAPPGAAASSWVRRFGQVSTAMCSGWMRIRGTRRRRALDRGFVLSDHVDWPGLLGAIEATGAEEVWVTHGYTRAVVRWLEERGLRARPLPTQFDASLEAEWESS